MILLEGLLTDKKSSYITPRGPFAISGYPKYKRVPKYVKKDIINKTKLLIGIENQIKN